MNADQETALKKVKVDRKKLIKKLKENLEKHEDEYAVAREGYRKERMRCMKALAEAAAKCDSDMSSATREAVEVAYRTYVNLDVPANHARSYKKAITVMEWREEDKVKLSMNDFPCYVEDDWNWKRRFRDSVSNYSARI